LSEGLSPSTYADFLNHGPDRAVRAAAGFEVDLVKQIDRRTNHDPVRRLTAILAADVAGYSRLRGADEEGTHERLKGHLRELVNPKIAEHRGRGGQEHRRGLFGRVRERS
jgi:class 3 adenylate cyclase